MEKIPTAEERFDEFFSSFPKYGVYLAENWKKEIIEIANKLANDKSKLHVEAALKEASENAEIIVNTESEYQGDLGDSHGLLYKDVTTYEIDKDSILNSYPLENIE